MNKKKFTKEAISVEEQIKLLKSRGLLIQDIAKTHLYLSTVGYYRLSSYAKVFQENGSNHIFKDNTDFEDIWNIYVFDRKLRLIVSDVIERIEIALRASLTNILAPKYGKTWYKDRKIFNGKWNYESNDRLSKHQILNAGSPTKSGPKIPFVSL